MTSEHQKLDVIIIGQGLAGSLLAWELLKKEQRVVIIDDGDESSSTKAAAGLINPVTGQRLVKTRDVDILLPAAIDAYQQLEKIFAVPLYTPRTMLRLFRVENEIKAWNKRKNDPAYQTYLGGEVDPADHNQGHIENQPGFYQTQTGNLSPATFLKVMKKYFIDHGIYQSRKLDASELSLTENSVKLGSLQAKHIIFCEGYKAQQNPWFDWLPFQPAKGEILTLKTDKKLPAYIINRGNWLLPLINGQFKFGATYDWNSFDNNPTHSAKSQLLMALNKLAPEYSDATLITHAAGVRPSTQDKNPFIGLHPKYPQIGIFNGFGSKGSLLIPWFARCFSDELSFKQDAIPAYANIMRHWKASQ